MTSSLARAIVRRYPAAWRERYADEVLALLLESGVRWRDLFDLSRGLVSERARAIVDPVERPVVAWVAYSVIATGVRTLPGFALIAVATVVGLWASRAFAPAPEWAGPTGRVAMISGLVVHQIWYWRAIKAGIPVKNRLPMPARLRVLVVGLVLSGLSLTVWIDPPNHWTAVLLWIYLPSYVASQVRPRVIPARDIPGTIGALWEVNTRFRAARREVNRCQLARSAGEWAPLIAAEVALQLVTEERDAIMEKLRSVGYRARFQS